MPKIIKLYNIGMKVINILDIITRDMKIILIYTNGMFGLRVLVGQVHIWDFNKLKNNMIDDHIDNISMTLNSFLKTFYSFLNLEKKNKSFPSLQNSSSKHTHIKLLIIIK